MPVTFNSAKDYNEIFEPLLIEEFKASLIRAYEEDGMTYIELHIVLTTHDRLSPCFEDGGHNDRQGGQIYPN